MRQAIVRGLALAAAGFGPAAADAGPFGASLPAKSKPFYQAFLPEAASAAPATPEGAKQRAADADAAPPSPADRAAAARVEQEKALLRRLSVCDRLRELALDGGDATLERRAEQLEAEAWDVYRKRTAGLPGGAGELPGGKR